MRMAVSARSPSPNVCSSQRSAFSQTSPNRPAIECGNTVKRSPAVKAIFKQPSRKMQHTDRKTKIANEVARHRDQRCAKVFEKRGGSEEFERIMDIMDRRNRDLMQAVEAKRFAASQFAISVEDEFENEDCCSILPVQYATQIERERLRELEERQRQIDVMEAEIQEYARMAEEEEARIGSEASQAHLMRQEQHVVTQAEAREPWDESDDDVEMTG